MFKKSWWSWAIIAVCGGLVIGAFYGIFHRFSDKDLPWWAYVIAAIIYGLTVYLGYLLIQIHAQKFDRMLQRENFHVDRRYEANGQTLCVDFATKRIANTYLSTKTFVGFDEVAGCRVESYRRGSYRVLPEEKRFLNLVIAVRREEPTPDHPYLYIAMFEVQVAAEDVPDTPDVTPELVDKYPELKPIYDLKRDVEQILALNSVNPASAD